jgi:thioredoxin reductase (NADPH)
MVVRGDSLESSMSSYLVERIRSDPRIDVRLDAEVVEVHGEENVESVTIAEAGTRSLLETEAVFAFIGAEPNTAWLDGLVARNEDGFVLSGPQVARTAGGGSARWPLERDPYLLETNIPGIFVAGDVREQSIKRVASAVGEGAMAVSFIHEYLREL